MSTIYIVVDGGMVNYVATDSPSATKKIEVTVIDLDQQIDDVYPPELLEKIESLPRIW